MTKQFALDNPPNYTAVAETVATIAQMVREGYTPPPAPTIDGTDVLTTELWRLQSIPYLQCPGQHLMYIWEVATRYETVWLVTATTALHLATNNTASSQSQSLNIHEERDTVRKRHHAYLNTMWPLVARVLLL